jgi:tetratricopeptide (TPR) repeat protein
MIRVRSASALVVLAMSLLCAGCGAHHAASEKPTAAPDPRAAEASAALDAPAARRSELALVRQRSAERPTEAYWPYRMAELYVDADSLGAAQAALERALDRDPLYAPALSLLSRIDFETGQNRESIARLAPARSPQSGFSDADRRVLLTGLALHFDALSRPDLAQALVDSLGDAGPTGMSPRVYLALRGTAPESGADLAARALKSDPNNAVNLNNYGIACLRSAEVEGAQRCFEKAIAIDPALPGPYYNLAILAKYYRFDDAAATRWLGLYRERSSDDPDGLFERFGLTAAGKE